jgi:Arc/MetJ-type ribon-helix-helix transcriptional regulator
MQQTITYPVTIRVRMPSEVADALDRSARGKFLTRSEYMRQAVLHALSADGENLTAGQNNLAEGLVS